MRGAALCFLPAWWVDKTRSFHSGWIRQHPGGFVWFQFHCSSTIDGSCVLFACTSHVLGLPPVLQRFHVASHSPSRSIHPRFQRLELPAQFLVFPDVFFSRLVWPTQACAISLFLGMLVEHHTLIQVGPRWWDWEPCATGVRLSIGHLLTYTSPRLWLGLWRSLCLC